MTSVKLDIINYASTSVHESGFYSTLANAVLHSVKEESMEILGLVDFI